MCGPEDPLFTPLLQFARVPFQAKVSVNKAPFWENLEVLASTASIFAQILALKPPKFGNFQLTSPQIGKFSVHKPQFWNFQLTSPPFQRQVLVRKPLTSEIRAAHPYLKKGECPPPPPGMRQHITHWPMIGTTSPWQQFPILSGLLILSCAWLTPSSRRACDL